MPDQHLTTLSPAPKNIFYDDIHVGKCATDALCKWNELRGPTKLDAILKFAGSQ